MSRGYFDCACCGDVVCGGTRGSNLCEICRVMGCAESGDSPSCRECILDGSRGVYVPQAFACNFDMTAWNVKADDVTILRAGPGEGDGEAYWETWSDLCGYGGAFFEGTRKVGARYYRIRWELDQDGDLFARVVNVTRISKATALEGAR